MVSCTTIEVQIVFEMLLALVTGQLAIASQLGRESTHRVLGCFLEVGDRDNFKEEVLVDEAAGDGFALF